MRRGHPLVGRQLIIEEDTFLFLPKSMTESTEDNSLLNALSKCTEETVLTSANLKAIHTNHNIEEQVIGPGIIFSRDFDQNLLIDVRANWRCVLIGSPGIGKSHFQFYYLARMMNPKLFGPLPPDHNGCTDAPRVVIRQIGTIMTVYDRENRVAYECGADRLPLKCFDPKVTLYLYEPGELKTEPFFYDLKLPMLATVPPYSSRYKSFTKHNAYPLYMPTYTCEELQAAGDYLLKRECVPNDMMKLYGPDQIKKRHHDFGGIYRHVLPSSINSLTTYYAIRRMAMDLCDAKGILSNANTIEDDIVSISIMATIGERSGLGRFIEFKTEFDSVDIESQVQMKAVQVALKEMIDTLLKNDLTGADSVKCTEVYEEVLEQRFTNPPGITCLWRKQGTEEWTEFILQLRYTKRGPCPKFNDMECDVLYWQSQDNFPAVEFFYHSGEGRLMAFQVTKQDKPVKEISKSAYKKFLSLVGLKDSTNVVLF